MEADKIMGTRARAVVCDEGGQCADTKPVSIPGGVDDEGETEKAAIDGGLGDIRRDIHGDLPADIFDGVLGETHGDIHVDTHGEKNAGSNAWDDEDSGADDIKVGGNGERLNEDLRRRWLCEEGNVKREEMADDGNGKGYEVRGCIEKKWCLVLSAVYL